MERTGLDIEIILKTVANLANQHGLESVTLKMLADELGVKTPSLYNYIKNQNDLKNKLMLYGWKEVNRQIMQSTAGIGGYEAIKVMCRVFYHYALENPGVFSAMLWYNKFQDEESKEATDGIFSVFLRITESLHISEYNSQHLVRTFRSFVEGFALLVNNNAFGNPISVEDSFELSLDIFVEGMKMYENR